MVHNDTRLRLIDVATGRELYETKALNNIWVAKQREDPLADDPVTELTDEIMQYVDEAFVMEGLPQSITPAHVGKRVTILTDSPPANLLFALTELRFYHDRGLLASEELTSAYQQMLGEEAGRQLADGALKEKAEVLADKLPPASQLRAASL
jgi:hypothetical protein